MASPMEVLLFDVKSENNSISEAKRSLELIDLLEICSEGSSSFICDSWVKFKPEYYIYWGQDFIFCQHIRLQKLWRSWDDPFHGLSQVGVKDKFIYVTGHGPSASAHGLWDSGELRSLTKRDSSFPHSTPSVVPSILTCIQKLIC